MSSAEVDPGQNDIPPVGCFYYRLMSLADSVCHVLRSYGNKTGLTRNASLSFRLAFLWLMFLADGEHHHYNIL